MDIYGVELYRVNLTHANSMHGLLYVQVCNCVLYDVGYVWWVVCFECGHLFAGLAQLGRY